MLLDVVKIIMDEKEIGDGEKLRLIEKIMDLSDRKSAEEKQAKVKIPPMCQRNNKI